ncbi:MAG: pyrrolo-quinoline quinone [Bryobacteraceae bacterium]
MLKLALASLVAPFFLHAASASVLTYHNDNNRTGWNPAETILTPANVHSQSFGKLFSQRVDGFVYAQPLVVSGVGIPGKGIHNVVYVATEHDSVYAFDAGGNTGQDASPLWHVSFLGAGVTTVPYQDTGCDQIMPEIGITGTPVIDPSSGTLFVVAMTKETSKGTTAYVHRLHALDITTGKERADSPVTIQATVAGRGDGSTTITFEPRSYKQRPGLLLVNGVVYAAFSSHCDLGRYHGWLIGYNSHTLAQVAVYNDTTDGGAASFWSSGAAPAAGFGGHIFLMSGNGTFNSSTGGKSLGDSFINLDPSQGMKVSDYFTPFNQQALSNGDEDLGSGGPLVLPNGPGSAAHPLLVIGAGKQGTIYLVDRANMGHFHAGSDNQIVQSLPHAVGEIFGMPAYFNNRVYFSGTGDSVKAFSLWNARLSPSPTSESPFRFGYPGSVPSVSSNGTANGIVWALENRGTAVLHAYDATNLARELYNSDLNRARDIPGYYVKFSAPTIANGRVYVGTQNSLVVYGLLQ